jgi:hypothetical protein
LAASNGAKVFAAGAFSNTESIIWIPRRPGRIVEKLWARLAEAEAGSSRRGDRLR